jgi:oligoendopeptidase F
MNLKWKRCSMSKKTADALPEWDLSDLYDGMDAPKLVRDLKKATKLTAEFAKAYKPPFAKMSGKKLAAAVADYEVIQELLGKLHSYGDLVYASDMSDAKRAQFYQNLQESLNVVFSDLLFFGLAINQIPEKDFKAKLKASKDLAYYGPWLRDVRAMKPYQLDDALEKLLVEKSMTAKSWVRLFDETISRMRFKIGKEELTEPEALDLLSHKNPAKRKQAAKVVGDTFAAHKETFALITNTLAKDKSVEDNWRGFARPITARNVANQVEDEVVDALIETVKANYKPLAHAYYKWKAKQFGQKKLDYWDRNAPLPGASDKKISWPDAVEIVQSSYAAFSPELAKIGQKFFDKPWIDVPVRAGKAPGAFAHPTVPSAHPYLLLNYQGKTRDVMTLAHELGHGVHQVLAADQGALMSDTPLTLAETASVFGEMLTFQELLRRETNDAKRQYLIAGKIEDMLNTVVRQIAFCDFERRVHGARMQGELSADEIGDIWMSVQSESLGHAIKLHPEYASYWMYIPHFIHTPFYVYAYAFGDCLVNSLYGVYQAEAAKGKKHAKAFEQKYLDMLRAGGTLRHKELLKPFKLDASQPDFWQQGLDVISGYIGQLD